MCSCKTPACAQKSRGPVGFSLPQSSSHWGQQEAGTSAESVSAEGDLVMAGEEVHPKQRCLFNGVLSG